MRKCVLAGDGFKPKFSYAPAESPTLLIVVTLVTLLSFFGMAIVALLFYRRVQLETQLANFWWSIKWEDISFPERSRKSASSLATNDEGLSKGSPVRLDRF